MKWALYNLLFALAYPFLLPGFILRMLRRGGYAARMGDRFALYPDWLVARVASEEFRAGRGPVWIHAVSVGEVQVAGQLMREWRQADPSVRFVFSTTSSTGWKMAEREVTPDDVLIYNPLDFPNFVKSALKTMRPRAIVLTESEIWPNFIMRAKRTGIPLFLINARVSDRSAPRYRFARFFFRDVFGAFTRIFAQSELDAERIRAAMRPADCDRVVVTGSFKFDVAHRNEAKERELAGWLGGERKGLLLLGGSTWPGEDKVLVDIYRAVRETDPGARLVIAPRHFEKADAVESTIESAGFVCVRRSKSEPQTSNVKPQTSNAIYLADTTGELMGLYGIADIVFVGKSLCAHGSQNMIEPCLCGKPTLVGPYTENFRPVMSDLLAGEAIVQVANAEELRRRIVGLAGDRASREALGERARRTVESRVGVVGRCVAAIVKCIGLVLVCAFFGCSKSEPADVKEQSRQLYRGVKAALVYAALVEKPDARKVLLADDAARELAEIFRAAGTEVVTNQVRTGVFDIVVGGKADDIWELAKTGLSVGDNGIYVRLFDVRNRKMGDLAEDWGGIRDSAHLWMAGEFNWALVMRNQPRRIKLSAMLELFDRDCAFAELAAARINGLADIFAGYVGTLDLVSGAFASLDGKDVAVRPEFFVPCDVLPIEWMVDGEVDGDIAEMVKRDIRTAQVIRRLVLDGVMNGAKGEMAAAVDCWTRAALRNPDDSLLRERLDTMERNAKLAHKLGNIKAAAKLFETLVLIEPKNVAALYNYGVSMKQLKMDELGDAALEKARKLEAELRDKADR